jgi:hypothetical protein
MGGMVAQVRTRKSTRQKPQKLAAGPWHTLPRSAKMPGTGRIHLK